MTKPRIHCNACGDPRWHDVLAHHEQERIDAGWGFEQKFEAEILRCCGCDLLTFRLITHPFEFQNETDKPEEELFPPRTDKKRNRKFLIMPTHIRAIYFETIAAYENELVLLSTVGLRSLIEAMVEDRIDQSKFSNSLESKIDALAELVEPNVLRVLHVFRQMGNAAVHEQQHSDAGDLHRAFFVVEALMEYFYGLSNKAEIFESGRKKPRARSSKKRKTTPRMEK